MDGILGGYIDRTFCVRIERDAIWPLNGGFATRVTLMGEFIVENLYIGPVSTKGPMIAAHLYPLTFNGGDKTAHVYIDDEGTLVPMITDPLPIGLDGSRGLIVTGYVSIDSSGVVGTQLEQEGWSAFYTQGNDAGNVDKSKSDIDGKPYTPAGLASIAVEMVEAYYTPPKEATGFYTPPHPSP